MGKLDNIQSSFGGRLDEIEAKHKSQVEAELQEQREQILRDFKPRYSTRSIESLFAEEPSIDIPAQSIIPPPHAPIQALVSMRDHAGLKQLDQLFIETFDLDKYYPTNRLNYPITYCHTLEEFWTPYLEKEDMSFELRKKALKNMVREDEEQAEKTGGGTFGYNLPGIGCYLNGWLFEILKKSIPDEGLANEVTQAEIYNTAVHEKLGHGFIGVYSAMGKVKTSLGLDLADIARRFNLRTVDDTRYSLRDEQSKLVFTFSKLLEEGWASWIASNLVSSYYKKKVTPQERFEKVIQAIKKLPLDIRDRYRIQDYLIDALMILFQNNSNAEDDITAIDIHNAVNMIELTGSEFDYHFESALGQPLRYKVGELLLDQAELNLGASCNPYTVLIAANLTFDPSKVSLTDMRELMSKEARLHPDARLALLSRLKLNQSGSLEELCRRAESELNLSVPPELKKKL